MVSNIHIWEYLWPENILAQSVVGIIGILFIVWLIYLIVLWVKAGLSYQLLGRCSDVTTLQNGLEYQERLEILSANRKIASSNGQKGEDPKPLPSLADILYKFCLEKNLPKSNPLYSHIKAIYTTGWKGSRLEIGELIKHTTSRLFRTNSLLRALLALFIVLGLLGTLFSLAVTLSELPLLFPQKDSLKSSMDWQDISKVLVHLKSAFAPSIWGVFLTILAVFLFGLYLRIACAPLKENLEAATLNIWIPLLIPTSPQRLIERSELQMQRSLEAVKKFVDIAEDIQSEAGLLKGNLRNANEILVPLYRSATDIREFTDKFKISADNLSSFQADIRNLYDQMIKDSSVFHGNVQYLVNRLDQYQLDTRDSLLAQNDQLQEILRSLKNYEESYAREREVRDQESRSVLNEARNVYVQVVALNREQIAQIDEKLGIPISAKLSLLNDSLNEKMREIRDSFSAMDAPLKAAADKIGDSLQTFDTHLMGNLDELRLEFSKQSADRVGQINVLRESSEKISSLLGSLKIASESLDKSNSAQTGNIQSLTTVLNLLIDKIGFLGSSIGSMPQKTDDFSKATEQLKKSIDEFGAKIKGFDLHKQLDEIELKLISKIEKLQTNIEKSSNMTSHKEDSISEEQPQAKMSKAKKIWRLLNSELVFGKKTNYGRRR